MDDAAPTDAAPGFTLADTPPAETEDETIARLAAMPLLEYERERVPTADRLGVRAPILDKVVQAKRGKAEAATGRGIALHDPQPWPEPGTMPSRYGLLTPGSPTGSTIRRALASRRRRSAAVNRHYWSSCGSPAAER
jgi:hypothetical protein